MTHIVDEAELLRLGLHLFAASARLGVDVSSEVDSALHALMLNFSTLAVMRLTSIRIRQALTKHPCPSATPVERQWSDSTNVQVLASEVLFAEKPIHIVFQATLRVMDSSDSMLQSMLLT